MANTPQQLQLEFEVRHQENIAKYGEQIRVLYDNVVREIVRASFDVNFDVSKLFSFAAYPVLNKKVNELLRAMSTKLVDTIGTGMRNEWSLSDKKNADVIKMMMRSRNLTKDQLENILVRNNQAREAFVKRRINGLTLSQKIYKQEPALKRELELALDVALSEGRSAQQISQDVRQYLEEPDKLFRKVRDLKGNLVLSKSAKAYHPGQGVYRSSKQNALRLGRTETNMAYRAADWENWNRLPFVVGYQIKRSKTPYQCDMCDSMVGLYPKWFKWTGNHPACRCIMIAIMATDEEMEKILERMIAGKDISNFKSINSVVAMPQGYVQYVKENKERLLRYKSQPFFIQDNYTNGSLTGKLKMG